MLKTRISWSPVPRSISGAVAVTRTTETRRGRTWCETYHGHCGRRDTTTGSSFSFANVWRSDIGLWEEAKSVCMSGYWELGFRGDVVCFVVGTVGRLRLSLLPETAETLRV